jgi:hypothetical protein
MNIELLKQVIQAYEENGCSVHTLDELKNCLIETSLSGTGLLDVNEGEVKYDINSCCWYRTVIKVIKVKDIVLAFEEGQYFGDHSNNLKSIPLFNWSAVTEARPYEETTTRYMRI